MKANKETEMNKASETESKEVAGVVCNVPPMFLEEGKDPQDANPWRGLPDPENHKCEDWINEDKDGARFCGVCGKEIK